MKTPRELLLKRYEAASPRLDALRITALPVRSARSTLNPQPVSVWERLFGPNPLAWAGLAAVWLVLIVVNRADVGAAPSSQVADRATAPPPEAIVKLVRERREQMAELLELEEPALRSRPVGGPVPKRSQLRKAWAVV